MFKVLALFVHTIFFSGPSRIYNFGWELRAALLKRKRVTLLVCSAHKRSLLPIVLLWSFVVIQLIIHFLKIQALLVAGKLLFTGAFWCCQRKKKEHLAPNIYKEAKEKIIFNSDPPHLLKWPGIWLEFERSSWIRCDIGFIELILAFHLIWFPRKIWELSVEAKSLIQHFLSKPTRCWEESFMIYSSSHDLMKGWGGCKTDPLGNFMEAGRFIILQGRVSEGGWVSTLRKLNLLAWWSHDLLVLQQV